MKSDRTRASHYARKIVVAEGADGTQCEPLPRLSLVQMPMSIGGDVGSAMSNGVLGRSRNAAPRHRSHPSVVPEGDNENDDGTSPLENRSGYGSLQETDSPLPPSLPAAGGEVKEETKDERIEGHLESGALFHRQSRADRRTLRGCHAARPMD